MTSNARIAINNVELARQNVLATIATVVGEDPENIFRLIEEIDELSELRTSLLRALSMMYDQSRPAPECVGHARQRLVSEKIEGGMF